MKEQERIAVSSSVSACRACSLCKTAKQPIPFKGPSDATLAVVGEAPGAVEDAVGTVFVGPSGMLANRLLSDNGFDPETVAWLNTVSCFPNRTPTQKEVEVCSGNVDRQLAHIAPSYILAMGGIAVSRWFKDIRMGDIRGQFFTIVHPVPAWVIATWHPAAILRNPRLEEQTVADIRRLRRVMSLSGRDPLAKDRGAIDYPFNANCILCGEFADRWLASDGTEAMDGRGGIAFCQKHWDRRMGLAGGGRTDVKARAKRARTPTNQEGMF